MKPVRFGAAALAFCALSAQAVNVKELALDVDCSAGESIAAALDRPVGFERRIIVTVKGVCVENVVIERDGVTLRAADSGASIEPGELTRPALLVNGARRAAIEGVSFRGGLHGVMIDAGAAASFRRVTVSGAVKDGIRIEGGSSALMDQSTIESNGQSGVTARAGVLTMTRSTVRNNQLSGVVATGGRVFLGATDGPNICCGNLIENNILDGVTVGEGSTGVLYGNTIRRNGTTGAGRFGVLVAHASSVRLVGGNLIEENGFIANNAVFGGGIFVRGSALRGGVADVPLAPANNEVSRNAIGINVGPDGALDLRAGMLVLNNLTHGVQLVHGSRMRMEATTIADNAQNGILAVRASSADLVGTANSVTRNGFGLFCTDVESSHSGNMLGVTGNFNGQISCTGF